jgi:protein-tyrosine kinase
MNAKMEAPDLYLGDSQSFEGAAKTKSIGELIQDARNLSADDLDRIGRYQRENDMRFGEAAIALGLADTEDVLQALAQQFKYAYADEETRKAAPELVMLNQPFGHQAEAFRAIRSQILMRTQGEKGTRRPLAVVSHDTGDGKTFFCVTRTKTTTQHFSKWCVLLD